MKRLLLSSVLLLALSARADGKPYQWNVVLHLDEDPMLVEALIEKADGVAIWSDVSLKPPGKPFLLAGAQKDVGFTIDVKPAANGDYVATFEAKRGEDVLQHEEATIPSAKLAPGDDLITVDIVDADLNDFLNTMRTLSGRKIILDPKIEGGRVTLQAEEIPWKTALQRAITPLGILMNESDDAIVLLKLPKP
ncbi:MAG TPA: hypothetical protein VHW00_17065 [Thermoanaerobaculia bacterium]|nr:hypothetical protein [Thermoanaerobaculia bacterium]